jgi:hypothetical protein
VVMWKDRWLWAILILGAAVRLFGLGERSLSYDECQQFWASQGNPLISNRQITLDPPFFAGLLHFHSFAGRSEVWLRLLPCLFGILAVAAVYRLARCAAGNAGTARTAAFFFALAPYPIRYSQSLRVYSLTLLLCALLPSFFLEAEGGSRSPRSRVLLALLACAALLTMYGALWLLLAMGLWLLIRAALRREAGQAGAIAALAAGALGALPLYLFSLPAQMREGTPASFYEDKFPPSGGLGAALGFLARGTLDLGGYFTFILPAAGILFGLIALLGIAVLFRSREGRAAGFLLAASVAAAAAASVFRLYPYGGTRQMLFAAPLFTTAAAAGIEALRPFGKGILRTGLLAAMAAGSGIFLVEYHTRPGGQEMRPVARYLEEHLRPGDRILVNKDAVPQFRFYYRGDAGAVTWGRETVIRDYVPEVNRILGAAPADRWWLVFSHGWDAARRSELNAVDPRFRMGERFEAHQAAAYLLLPEGLRDAGAAADGSRP